MLQSHVRLSILFWIHSGYSQNSASWGCRTENSHFLAGCWLGSLSGFRGHQRPLSHGPLTTWKFTSSKSPRLQSATIHFYITWCNPAIMYHASMELLFPRIHRSHHSQGSHLRILVCQIGSGEDSGKHEIKCTFQIDSCYSMPANRCHMIIKSNAVSLEFYITFSSI